MKLKSDKLEQFLSKKKNITLLYLIVIISILILAFARCAPEKTPAASSVSGDTADIEAVLTKALEAMEGVGKVHVAVTYESGKETVPIFDREGEKETVVKLGSGTGAHVVTQKEIMPRVRGVMVVADGGGDSTIRANILAAVRALTDAPAHNITVFKAK